MHQCTELPDTDKGVCHAWTAPRTARTGENVPIWPGNLTVYIGIPHSILRERRDAAWHIFSVATRLVPSWSTPWWTPNPASPCRPDAIFHATHHKIEPGSVVVDRVSRARGEAGAGEGGARRQTDRRTGNKPGLTNRRSPVKGRPLASNQSTEVVPCRLPTNRTQPRETSLAPVRKKVDKRTACSTKCTHQSRNNKSAE